MKSQYSKKEYFLFRTPKRLPKRAQKPFKIRPSVTSPMYLCTKPQQRSFTHLHERDSCAHFFIAQASSKRQESLFLLERWPIGE
jgi:hypothetical protein